MAALTLLLDIVLELSAVIVWLVSAVAVSYVQAIFVHMLELYIVCMLHLSAKAKALESMQHTFNPLSSLLLIKRVICFAFTVFSTLYDDFPPCVMGMGSLSLGSTADLGYVYGERVIQLALVMQIHIQLSKYIQLYVASLFICSI